MSESNNHDTSKHYISKLEYFKDPIILELGVNRGGSTKKFLKHVNQFGGKLFSIDIKDCSQIFDEAKYNNIDLSNWKFLKSNDLNIEYIINKFPKLKYGIDILFIDSYHDETHVKKILEKWFIYVNKNGYIFFDDTESVLYRKSKNYFLSIINDALNELVYKLYCNNIDQLEYIKYFKGSGMSEFKKLSELGSNLNFSNKIWKYNFFVSKIYLFLKRMLYQLKSKDKNKPL